MHAADGLHVRLRSSKTDQEGAALAAMHHRGPATEHCCRDATVDPAHAEDQSVGERWLFPTVHRTGQPSKKAMTGDAVAMMIQRRAADAGGHSLRSGFVTEAFRAGADAHSIMRQTGHKDPKMLEVYAREHAPLVGNAVTRLDI